MTLADVDADGDLDLLSAGFDGPNHDLQVHRNDGSGIFTLSGSLPLPAAGATWRLLAFDLDDDGDVDLLVAGDSIQVDAPWTRLFVNDGRGLFGACPPGAAPEDMRPLGSADLDGDGDLDVVGAEHLFANLHRQLSTPLVSRLGHGFPVEVRSMPGPGTGPTLAAVYAAPLLRSTPFAIPAVGRLFLDEAVTHQVLTVVLPPSGSVILPLAVPNVPALAHAALHLQAVILAPGHAPRLTNATSDVLLR